MLLLILILVIYKNDVKTQEYWKDPKYMVVSPVPLYIDATIDVQSELINNMGYEKFTKYYLEILTQISRILAWHNIKFNVNGMNFWLSQNEIQIGNTIADTASKYSQYVYDNPDESDVHILFVDINNTDTNLGKSFVNGVCTKSSYCVTQVGYRAHWDPVYASLIVAHEIGHLLGFGHVDEKNTSCKCPWENFKCIMKPQTYSWNSNLPTSYDSCSMKELVTNPPKCLLDNDRPLFNSNDPVCGNNILEEGEECDCGFEESCILMGRRRCCDPNTCKLTSSNYECDEGSCCENCKFNRGKVCKSPSDECDIKDFCSGDSHWCTNYHKSNGVKCNGGEAFCMSGECLTKNKYCNKLFPNSKATTYSQDCYNFAQIYTNKNCVGLSNNNFINMFCGTGKGICGQVYCNGPVTNDPFYRFSSGSLECYTLLDNSQTNNINKVPDGGVCGSNKVCVNGNCVDSSMIELKCRKACRLYEECANLEGICVPNDERWFSTYSGSPNKPE